MVRPDPVERGAYRLFRFDVLDSTQSELKRGPYQDGDIVLAATQTGAYGRRGRAWQAPRGNLLFSIKSAMPDPSMIGWIAYAIGLALYDAVLPYVRDVDALRLKWPNDLLVHKKKLSGILIEVEGNSFVTGIGLNLATMPRTDQPVACLDDHALAPPVSTDAVLDGFLAAFDHWSALGMDGGFAAMRADWLARAAYTGESITARLANGTEKTGIFETINPQGGLVLRSGKDHYVVTSAEIFLT